MNWLGWRLRLAWWRHRCGHYRWRLNLAASQPEKRAMAARLHGAVTHVHTLELQGP